MTYNNQINLLLAELQKKKAAYSCWFYPESEVPELLIGQVEDVKVLPDFSYLVGQKGFLFAPFECSASHPLLLLSGSIYLKGFDQISHFRTEQLKDAITWSSPARNRIVISRDDYLDGIRKTVDHLKNSDLSKVIISRLITHPRKQESMGDLLLQLHQQTPRAFVYVVSLPYAGTWIGATPEVLLRSHGDELETVSLAGTQPSRDDENYLWPTKEIEEQAFVSRYMLDLFYRYQIYPYHTQGPETMASGPVAHLKTRFFFDLEKVDGKLSEFIGDLHPTPAVCGLPKEAAASFIRKIEKHDRCYYAGFLGPWNLDDQVRLFVNLRCMEVLSRNYVLYSGGGITSRSVPESEWEETRNKAQTLLSAIQVVQQ